MAVFAARKALQDAGVDARDLDFVIVATMSADEITPNCAPLVAHALGAERAAAFDIGAACTGFLAGLSPVRGADRGRPRGARPADRRREAHPHHRLQGQEDRDAVRRRRGRGRARPDRVRRGHRPDRPACRRRHRGHDHGHPRGPVHPHGRDLDVQDRRQAPERVDRLRARGGGHRALRHRPVRLPPGQQPDPQGGRRAARARHGEGRRLHRAARQHERGVDPADALARRARTAACAPGTRCSWPRSARASRGAPA